VSLTVAELSSPPPEQWTELRGPPIDVSLSVCVARLIRGCHGNPRAPPFITDAAMMLIKQLSLARSRSLSRRENE